MYNRVQYWFFLFVLSQLFLDFELTSLSEVSLSLYINSA